MTDRTKCAAYGGKCACDKAAQQHCRVAASMTLCQPKVPVRVVNGVS